MNTPYDKLNAQHEDLLLKFWNITFPDTPLESRITAQWGDVGFQGKVCVFCFFVCFLLIFVFF